MRLGRPEYLIHGTNKPWGVGMRVSHGCIRLYPEDIESLFQQVSINTPVNIINQPYKVGGSEEMKYILKLIRFWKKMLKILKTI